MSNAEDQAAVSGQPDAQAELLRAVLGAEFHLLRQFGEGVMSVVYLAREAALERLVAIKVLRPELASDDVIRQRFSREARAAARVVHPNVVVVHRVGELDGGLPYLIMEYVEGRTLADVLAADGPLGLEPACALLGQVAAALTAAHHRGIIHRDLRPGNILIEHETQRVVLTDFGLAGIKETGSEVVTRLTRVGEALGDPRYSSPEQLLGERVTEVTDVFSFGIVGFEVLGGDGPFVAATQRERVIAHLQRAPRPLHELRPDAPPELARLLERCLARKPEHRPRAAEIAASLDTLTNGASADNRQHAGEAPFFPALSSFLGELKRRRVYRAAATYLAVAFVALQGADIVLPALPLPPWTLTALVMITLAGFPVVLVLTWIYDLNRSGLERTPGPAPQLPGDRIALRALQAGGIVVSLLAAGLLAWWLLD